MTIADNDAWPSLQFGPSSYSVKEAGGAVNLVVKRVGSTTGTSTVDYATQDGTALAGSDYTATSGTLTFGPGVKAQTIPVPVTDDGAPEDRETFTVVLGNAGNAVLGKASVARVTILDDDQGLFFAASSYTVTENRPRATLTVKRSGGTAGTLTVDYGVVGGTATGGGIDYDLSDGSLTFPPRVTTRSIPVTIVHNPADQGSRTVDVALSNASVPSALRSPSSTTLTITDVEPVFKFALAKYKVTEASRTVLVRVTRTGPTTASAQVDYSVLGGTATGGGVDYSGGSGTLTFAPRVASLTFPVAVVADTLDEPDETVVFQLGSGTLPIGTPGTTTLTITDNDTAGKVQLSAATYSVLEGETATITLARSGGKSGGATVHYSTSDGTARVADGDYASSSGTLTFGPGETTKTFAVAATADGIVDGNETVNLTLSSPSGGLVLGGQATATLWIVDADGP